VSNETATGSVSVNRVRTQLTIRIETIEWDTQGCVLRVKGRNITENQYVKVSMNDLITVISLSDIFERKILVTFKNVASFRATDKNFMDLFLVTCLFRYTCTCYIYNRKYSDFCFTLFF